MPPSSAVVTSRPYGHISTSSGAQVYGGDSGGAGEVTAYTLRNSVGITAEVINYGATLISLKLPTATGDGTGAGAADSEHREITLSLPSLEAYLQHDFYAGATVGRVANRIANARFSLDGRKWELSRNSESNPHHLHGGKRGLDKHLWKARILTTIESSASSSPFSSVGVEFTTHSPAGDQGYPGNVDFAVTYILTDDSNELRIHFTAVADQRTPVSMTNHTYWNLGGGAGEHEGSILDHTIQICSDRYLLTDAEQIPTGEIRSMGGGGGGGSEESLYDFRKPTKLSDRMGQLGQPDGQSLLNAGYDTCYLLKKPMGRGGGASQLQLAARVSSPRAPSEWPAMEVWTTHPAMQFYTGNFLERRHSAFCLEPQAPVDAVNHPEWWEQEEEEQEEGTNYSSVVEPGQVYRQEIVFKFCGAHAACSSNV